MKTMEDYTVYCTADQTKRAKKLGAPIAYHLPSDKHGCYEPIIPTTQQMMGWLGEKGFLIKKYGIDLNFVGYEVVFFETLEKYVLPICVARLMMDEQNKAELAAIDAALDYLEKGESK